MTQSCIANNVIGFVFTASLKLPGQRTAVKPNVANTKRSRDLATAIN